MTAMKNYLFCLIALTLFGCKSFGEKKYQELKNNNQDFQVFWKEFRTSVISNDTLKILSMCKFPLEIRGDQDTDPVRMILEKEFNTSFQLFLKRQIYFGEEKMTNIDFVKKNPDPEASFGYTKTDTWRRVGDLEFVKTDKGWVLSLFYFPIQ